MARFGLAARMEEVEASMFADDNDNIVDGNMRNSKLSDKDIMYFEEQGTFNPELSDNK